jgi:hypothetical protein
LGKDPTGPSVSIRNQDFLCGSGQLAAKGEKGQRNEKGKGRSHQEGSYEKIWFGLIQ